MGYKERFFFAGAGTTFALLAIGFGAAFTGQLDPSRSCTEEGRFRAAACS